MAIRYNDPTVHYNDVGVTYNGTDLRKQTNVGRLVGIPWEDVTLEVEAVFLFEVDLKVDAVTVRVDRRYSEDDELLAILYDDVR